MSGYSGTTSFVYEIERYKHKQTGEVVCPSRLVDEDEFDYLIVPLNVEGFASFMPGKYTGPWENSYPDEGETEILSLIGPDGKDWEDKLSMDERNDLMAMIEEEVADDNYEPDTEDY